LIQAAQESEAGLEEIRAEAADEEKRMKDEVGGLQMQIAAVEAKIAEEDARARVLEEKNKTLNQTSSATPHDRLLSDLHKKVREAHRKCVAGDSTSESGGGGGGAGAGSAQMDTLTMLAELENKLEGLLDALDGMPPERVEAAEKSREKDRRRRLREMKSQAARLLQEDRVKRAMERARAPVKKQQGKKVMWRSRPVEKRKEVQGVRGVVEEEDA
ncbi:Cilia- and flagella-associated protein 100, partial [Gonapodya sp. JEL0774]